MIKQINRIISNLVKSEYELILDNLICDRQKAIFEFYYIKKLPKSEIIKTLKISRYNLDKDLENVRNKIGKLPQFDCRFRCDDVSENRLRDRCRKLGKSKEYEDFCVLAFINKLKNREIGAIMFIELDTVKKYKRDRRKELERGTV